MKTYLKRQQKILSQLADKTLFVLSAAQQQTRSNDTEFPFRQNSDFYYTTGFKEDNAFLVLLKINSKTKRILFVQEKDESMELWTGKRLGEKGAKAIYDYDEVYVSSNFDNELEKLLEGVTTLSSDIFNDAKTFLHVKGICAKHNEKRSSKVKVRNFHDATSITQAMRLIKDKEEIALIKEATRISALAHHSVMAMNKVGKKEFELQAEYEYIFKSNGAYNDAYTTIIAGGNSANTLHYIENLNTLVEGELILIDAGCEYEMYASDITRTIPVNGKFSAPQKELYEKILEVELQTIAMIKPGIKKSELQSFSEIALTKVMIELNLLEGDVATLIQEKKHKKYYPHGIGHWMGIDVHDQAPYFDEEGEEIIFKEGMVLTIEPGIYIDKDDESVPLEFRGIGIRIEDDILVSANGHENLTQGIAKSVDEIEALFNS